MTVEKNDVDIQRLFTWGKKQEIVNSEGDVEAVVYMRLLGDEDINKARVFALRKSAELRRKLYNPDSDERIAHIREIYEVEKEDLINFVLVFSMREITDRAWKTVIIPAPKPPKSNSKLEKMEQFQKEVDEYPEKRRKAVQEFITKEADELKKSLQEKDKEELYKLYVKGLIDEFCELEAYKAYREYEVYLGCYKDENYSERFFSSFEKYANLEPNMKNRFRAAYETLDISMDELKKLREATQ